MKIIVCVFAFFNSVMGYSQITMNIKVRDNIGFNKKIDIELINYTDEAYAIPIDTTGVQGNDSCVEKIVSSLKPSVHMEISYNAKSLEYDHNFGYVDSEYYNNAQKNDSKKTRKPEEIFVGIKPKQKIIYSILFDPTNFNDKISYHELFFITPNVVYDLSLSFCVKKKSAKKIGKTIVLNNEYYKPYYGEIKSNKVYVQWGASLWR